MFKKGDLFFLNTEGYILFKHIHGENGIVMSNAYLLYECDYESKTQVSQYYGYDILINGRLFTEIPEKFLSRVTKREENNE